MAVGEDTTTPGRLALTADDVVVTYEIREERPYRTLKGRIASAGRRVPPRRVEAVRGATFDLHEGEALGLVGLNGSGKSSLLRAVAGLMPVRSGRIRARSEPVLLGVGAALHPELSGRRNVFLGGTALGLSKEEVASRFDEIVDFAGVANFIDMPLRTFSSGMQSRLRFAIAAAVEPDILLIDEVLAVGDATFRAKSEERMRELTRKAGAIVLVSHSLGSVREMCSRVIWLHEGVIQLDGPASEVLLAYEDFAHGLRGSST
jgi:teichoic acid transport system ATP-binding protein